MRNFTRLLLPTCLALTVAEPVRGQDTVRAVIDKAILAAGGAAKLSAFKALRVKFDCTAYLGSMASSCTLEAFFQWPDQLKTDLRCGSGEQKYVLVQVVNGDKAWRSENGETREATGHNLTELQEDLYFQRIETLLPLISDAGFRLSPADETVVNGRAAAGVKVASEGHRDVTLYFDKEMSWMVKSVHLLPDLNGKELFRETVFGEFRDIDGSKQFSKMEVYQDGKRVLDAKLSEIKFMDQLDAGVFGRP